MTFHGETRLDDWPAGGRIVGEARSGANEASDARRRGALLRRWLFALRA
jgi:hypothetical protein